MMAGKGWNGQAADWRGTLVRPDGNITVGVCAREKKALSKHMVAITARLDPKKFEVTTKLLLGTRRALTHEKNKKQKVQIASL